MSFSHKSKKKQRNHFKGSIIGRLMITVDDHIEPKSSTLGTIKKSITAFFFKLSSLRCSQFLSGKMGNTVATIIAHFVVESFCFCWMCDSIITVLCGSRIIASIHLPQSKWKRNFKSTPTTILPDVMISIDFCLISLSLSVSLPFSSKKEEIATLVSTYTYFCAINTTFLPDQPDECIQVLYFFVLFKHFIVNIFAQR